MEGGECLDPKSCTTLYLVDAPIQSRQAARQALFRWRWCIGLLPNLCCSSGQGELGTCGPNHRGGGTISGTAEQCLWCVCVCVCVCVYVYLHVYMCVCFPPPLPPPSAWLQPLPEDSWKEEVSLNDEAQWASSIPPVNPEPVPVFPEAIPGLVAPQSSTEMALPSPVSR